MKPLFATIALLLVSGCASKPKNCDVNHFDWAHVPRSPLMVCNSGAWVPAPESGSISHVTPSQWEAAQGLYVYYAGHCIKEHRYPCREVITKVGTRQDFDISLPPGDTK